MNRLVPLSLIVLTLAACGTSPEPSYYVITPLPGSEAGLTSAKIHVERPDIPNYLDRPDIVRREGDFGVNIDEQNRWAEPLDRMFARVLAADLQQRLPSASVNNADEDTDTRFSLSFGIQSFNLDDDGARLKGTMSLYDKYAPIQPAPMVLNMKIESGTSPAAQAQALSKLLSQLADRIACDLEARSKKP